MEVRSKRIRRRERKKKSKKGIAIILSILVIGGIGGILWGVFFKTPLLMATPASLQQPPNPIISLNELNSEGALLYDLTDGRIVFEKNMDEKVYPASLTKVMTAVVALEKLSNMEEKVTVTNDTIARVQEEEASVAGFEAGEEVSVKDLLYGLILPSGGDAALTLADRISGSEAAFVTLMNEKAKELGMDSTNFSTSTGLQEENQVTTSSDLFKLLSYALSNPEFVSIWETQTYITSPTNLHSEGLTLESTVLSRVPELIDGTILGGKTGFTDEAGLCLLITYQKGDKNYLLVLTGCPGDPYNSILQQDDINYMNRYI